MISRLFPARPGIVASVLAASLALAACIPDFGPAAELTRPASASPATVSPGAAAAMISSYRKSKGLPGVTLDPKLMAIAETQARKMASAGKMAHVLPGQGSFQKRLEAGGYDAAIAAENIAAGAVDLDQAMLGWKKSRGHNANLLKPGVTQIGIAVAWSPNSKYHDFWSLVLATPDTPRAAGAGGPTAGPAAIFAGQ